MKVTKEIKGLQFHQGRMIYDVNLQEGLRVKPISGRPGMYWLDEFPSNPKPGFTAFCRDSFLYHDAVHYGIRLGEDYVKDA